MTMTVSEPLSLSCKPRFATEPTGRPNRLDEFEAVAEFLGIRMMPWQRYVASVATEYDPDTGVPAYRSVTCTLPRQNGKTVMMLLFELHRALFWGSPQRIVYTAQTGLDARRKLLEDQVPAMKQSRVAKFIERVSRAQGSEGVTFGNGSRIDIQASNASAGHGRTLDLGVIDEAFDDEDDRREQAMLPAMATRRDAQLLLISTAGTEQSVYLRRKVEEGRHAVLSGATSNIAYFEWSADDDADLDDPETWRACMPALGHTIDESVIEHARATMTDGEFARAYGNVWTASEDRVIPQVVWDQVQSASAAIRGVPVFGVDAQPSRSSAVIVAADEFGNVEVLERRPGVSWLRGRLAELVAEHGGSVAVDSGGPLGGLDDDLARDGVQVHAFNTTDMKRACGVFFDRVADRELDVRSDASLDEAVAGAAMRSVGDAWLWGRVKSNVDISPLVAATLAVAASSREPEDDFWSGL